MFWQCHETSPCRFLVVHSNSPKNLSAPIRFGDRPQGDADVALLKKACFGSLFQKMSLESLETLPALTMCGFVWRVKIDQMKWQREEFGQRENEVQERCN